VAGPFILTFSLPGLLRFTPPFLTVCLQHMAAASGALPSYRTWYACLLFSFLAAAPYASGAPAFRGGGACLPAVAGALRKLVPFCH